MSYLLSKRKEKFRCDVLYHPCKEKGEVYIPLSRYEMVNCTQKIATRILGNMRTELESLHIDLKYIIEDLEYIKTNSKIYGTGYGSIWKKQTS